jgi:hypothetical protein
MSTPLTNMNEQRNATSQGDGMSNMDFLISQANRLRESFHSWNHAYLVFVVITAVVTSLLLVITGLIQWTASRKAEELSATQDAVIRAKDEQMAYDNAHRDDWTSEVCYCCSQGDRV